jgi:hypothetical protein
MNFFQHFCPNKLFALHLPTFDPAQKGWKKMGQSKWNKSSWGLNVLMFNEEHKYI